MAPPLPLPLPLAAVAAAPSTFADFGADWLYVAAPGLALLSALVVCMRVAARAGAPVQAGRPLLRAAQGASLLTGLPAWCAGPLLVATGALVFAVQGFVWDVAWHIDIGRDEFLFSPPHVCLLLGLGLLAVAGLVGITTASRDRADVGWRVDRWRVPLGAAALLTAGGSALVAFGVDELWHWAYGLDVTMWSPPHLTMISAAAFSPLALWLLLAEAGPTSARPAVRRLAAGFVGGAALIGLSAWMLEFDLGVPQWPAVYHPLLVALAAGVGLCTARAALGRGGALVALAWFVGVRGGLALLTSQEWGLTQPRFVPYVAAAIAVEAAFALVDRRSPRWTALAAGAGVATLGLAGAWAAQAVWGYHPWRASLGTGLVVVAVVALAAAHLGTALGRVLAHRPSLARPRGTATALLVIALAVASPLPRTTPPVVGEVRTAAAGRGPAGDALVDVAVTVSPPDGVEGAQRFEVMAWQGGGFVIRRLERVGPGEYRTTGPAPVGGGWKTLVRLADGSALGAIPVAMPADPEIGASPVPLVPVRSQPFDSDSGLLLREAREGPAWPGIVGYSYVAATLALLIGLLVAGAVSLERRRRGLGWTAAPAPLAGRRVVLTGSEGGIGRAARAALEAQGATVVGLDLHAPRPGTIAVDVRDAAGVQAAVAEASRRMGGIDTVVANAGIGLAEDSTLPPDERARAVLDVNLLGAWHAVAAAAPALEASGRGQVVLVASGLAVATVPYAAAYTASKRALTGYADVLRLEAAGRLRVTTVNPGYILTPIHDGPAAVGLSLDGIARCETVADAAAAIVTACETGRRELGSSPTTTAELWLARRFPGTTDRVITRRWRAAERTRPAPRLGLEDRAAAPAHDPSPAGVPADEPVRSHDR